MKQAKKIASAVKKVGAVAKKVEGLAKKVDNIAHHPMRTVGGALGSKLGSRRVGEGVGGFLGKISGTGDYKVMSNSLFSHSATLPLDSVPQFMKRGQRETRVTHREYLGKVTASAVAGQFNVTSYPLNPGMNGTFPWLSMIANQFDQWRPNGIVVVYKSASSTYSGTSSLGIITLASDYDVLDPTYTSAIEMNNSDFAVSGNVAQNLLHPLECSLRERPTRLLNTRASAISGNDSLRWYDLANVQIATEGCTANQVCGEIWISYDISFFKAQVARSPLTLYMQRFTQYGDTVVNDANPFGTVKTFGANNNLDVTTDLSDIIFNNTSGDLTGKCFFIVYRVFGTNVFLNGTNAITYTYDQAEAGPAWGATLASNNSSSTAGSQIISYTCVRITAPGNPTVGFDFTLVGTPTQASLMIIEVPDLDMSAA